MGRRAGGPVPAAGEAAVLRARGLLARRDYAAALAALAPACAGAPDALWPRVIRSHVLLQEGRDPDAAERAVRDVLALDPGNAQAQHNLYVLAQRRGGAAAGPG